MSMATAPSAEVRRTLPSPWHGRADHGAQQHKLTHTQERPPRLNGTAAKTNALALLVDTCARGHRPQEGT
jgi:hypothetical protein